MGAPASRRMQMNKAKFLKMMLVMGIVATCACGLFACNSEGSSSAASSSGAVAATVNDETIYEDDVTTTVQNLRTQSSLQEEDAWGEFLVSSDMTPDGVRKQIIDSRVDEILAQEGAKELKITVDDSEIDTYVESMKTNFDDDEAWENALTQAGFTAESYRDSIRNSLTQQAVSEHFENEAKVKKADTLEAAESYASYYDGAKRSSHILIKVDNVDDKKAMKKAREKAQDIIDEIKSGEISFEDAAKKYSEDTGSAEKGGDAGWDVLNSFVTEYTDALDKLKKGDISDPVDSQFGVHIITVTDEFNAPKKVKSIEDFPEEFRDSIKDYAKSVKGNKDYEAWLEDLKEKADIQINDMPADVPYNIDLSKYQTDESASSESASAESASSESAEAEASDASASAESASAESASAESASAESADAEAGDASASAESADSESSADSE